MLHQGPEWEDTAAGSACLGSGHFGSEGGASQAQQGQHCRQHDINPEAAAAELGLDSKAQAREVAQASGKELAGAPQADDGRDMGGSVIRAERLLAGSGADPDPRHARHLEARAQPDIDSAQGGCTAIGWREGDAHPSPAPALPRACGVLAARTDEGSLLGTPGIFMSIAAEAVPFEGDAEGAELSADAEATGACRSQQMNRGAHSSACTVEGEDGMQAQDAVVAQAIPSAQQRSNDAFSGAADDGKGIPVSVSQCNMLQVPEEAISELADLAPIGWQRHFEASLYGPAPGGAGQAGNTEPAAGLLIRPAQGPEQIHQESGTVRPGSHVACEASAAGRPQLASAVRWTSGRGQGAVSVAGPADDAELEAVPAAGASQTPAAAQQQRRGALRKLAACPAGCPAAESKPEAGAAAVPATEASQASKQGQQRPRRPSCARETRQSKGQQPLMSLYAFSLLLSLRLLDAILQPWQSFGLLKGLRS